MKRIHTLLTASLLLAAAHLYGDPLPVMNTISLALQAEQWVTTNQAQVVIQIDGSLRQSAVDKLYKTVHAQLAKIANDQTQWHIVQLQQQKDASGLERITIQAQARIAENKLAHLREKTTALSEPGIRYSLLSIQYVPSIDDVERARAGVREKIYRQINEELERVNKQYKDRPYHVSRIYFNEPTSSHPLMGARNKIMAVQTDTGPSVNPSAAVSKKVVVTASVQLSTQPLVPKHA
ncbi:MAG: hypothetical protein ACX932_02600 [Gammaproteobacteria bacterium]